MNYELRPPTTIHQPLTVEHSMKRVVSTILLALFATASLVRAQQPAFPPVTEEMLLKPSPNDWLMFSRTYDAQRFSPLNQITTQNVAQLRMAWSKEMGTGGSQESIPLVYNGVM